MKITYIYHSCFVAESQEDIYIFDYYQGELPELARDKKIRVFASHAHYDHYNKKIFNLLADYPDVTYVLSEDITDIPARFNGQLQIVAAGQQYQLDGLTVRTLRSTDEGVAFIIEAKQHNIYYAGDLNWWHWEGEADSWNADMAAAYKRAMAELEGSHFTVAFVPVDGRLGAAYSWGLAEFMKHAEADHIFPMHQWDRYELTDQLKAEIAAAAYAARIHKVSGAGEGFIIAE